MAQLTLRHDMPPIIERKLAQVRRGIRTYVWLEGLALVVTTLVVAFWAGMLLDWLFEPPPAVRLVAMAGVGLFSLWVAYRYLLRRAFVPLPTASLAVLLERRFTQLKDHLLTAVDLAEGDDDTTVYHPEMVAKTRAAAANAAANVDAKELFRRGPLASRVFLAALLAATIPIAAYAKSDVFGFWLQRLALSNELWPRRVQLDVLGFAADAEGRRTHKVARDDKFELVVHADTQDHVAPRQVEFRFTEADGGYGRDTMTRIGEAVAGRDNFQEFRYEFKDVSSSMMLDVIGGDDRVEGLELEIVERPELVGMEIECIYPKYLNRPPRRLPITGGMRIPEGTQLTLVAQSTKPLTDVRVTTGGAPQPRSLQEGTSPLEEVRWDYGKLEVDDLVTIQATDIDGVTCREPYRISLAVIPDELPQVSVRLTGIGTAITPDATIPFEGKVTDDYGLDRTWFSYQVNDGPTRERLLGKQPEGSQEQSKLGAFDTREAEADGEERAVTMEPGQTLFLSVRATDQYDLNEAERIGASQQFALDVVTVPQLLALLERRELELRQRFEAVFAKMTDTRNLLTRVEFHAGSQPEADAEKALARRRLRVAGSLQNVTQSAHEVLGLADAFDDMYQQLENNRIDNVDLKTRLREQIGQPLRLLGGKSMTRLESQLQTVNERLADPTEGARALADSMRQADAVLVEMQQILDRMLELESYNEVVGLLRGIIDDQQQLNDRTKQQQADRIKDLFEDEDDE